MSMLYGLRPLAVSVLLVASSCDRLLPFQPAGRFESARPPLDRALDAAAESVLSTRDGSREPMTGDLISFAKRPDLRKTKLETITAYGKVWDIDLQSGTVVTDGIDLRRFAHYAKWPCAGQGAACVFDTHAYWLRSGAAQLVEVITARGRRFLFDADKNYAPLPENDQDLTQVKVYTQSSTSKGPCWGMTGGSCRFETQFIEKFSPLPLVPLVRVDSVIAGGRYWNFDVEASYVDWGAGNGHDLTEVSRYVTAIGPCPGAGLGQCHFDTRVLLPGNLESITARGRMFEFDGYALTPTANNNIDLKMIPRYANGPCRDAGTSACQFETRAIADLGIL